MFLSFCKSCGVFSAMPPTRDYKRINFAGDNCSMTGTGLFNTATYHYTTQTQAHETNTSISSWLFNITK